MTARLDAAAQYGVVAVRHPAGDGSVSWLTYGTFGTVIDTIWAAAAGRAPVRRPPRTMSRHSDRQADRRAIATVGTPCPPSPRMRGPSSTPTPPPTSPAERRAHK